MLVDGGEVTISSFDGPQGVRGRGLNADALSPIRASVNLVLSPFASSDDIHRQGSEIGIVCPLREVTDTSSGTPEKVDVSSLLLVDCPDPKDLDCDGIARPMMSERGSVIGWPSVQRHLRGVFHRPWIIAGIVRQMDARCPASITLRAPVAGLWVRER